jgi:hypothetical protein
MKFSPGMEVFISPEGRLNFKLVQIIFPMIQRRRFSLKVQILRNVLDKLVEATDQSRRDETIKSPARKCRVSTSNGSSPGRDGTERHSSQSASSWFDPDPQPDFPSQGCSRRPSNKINPTEPTNPLIWTALDELSPGR